jgi:DNA-binding SARP family transcriptional activator
LRYVAICYSLFAIFKGKEVATKELRITLLGDPAISLDGEPVTGFVSSKAQALVFYLAATDHPHTRESLAGLLWSDRPENAAKSSLRNALTNLRQLIGPYLDITHQTVALHRDMPLYVDCERRAAQLSGVQWDGSTAAAPAPEDLIALKETADLVQGDFLDGFYVADAPLFEEWMLAEREHLRLELEETLERLVRGYVSEEISRLPSPSPIAGWRGIRCVKRRIAR